MRLTPTLKYQLNGMKWPVIIFYIVIYSMIILLSIMSGFRKFEMEGTFGGLDAASMIFLFVVGLNSFKSTFHMFAANGISRKTMFTSFVTTAAILCAGMALIDSINSFVIGLFVNYQPAWFQMFNHNSSGFAMYGEGFLWMLFSYLSCIMLGYFITTAYYRMNKALKLTISIGVPVLFFILLPIIDAQLFSGEIFRFIGNIIAFCSGRLSGSPYVAIAMDIAFAALTGLFAYLLARRAAVKISAG